MSRYRKIDTRIHNDAKFRALDDGGKLLFLTLLTHPGMTMLGAMRGTAAGLAAEMNWAAKAFREAFTQVLAKGMAEFDEEAHLIALPNFLKYNKPESPNVVKSWAAVLDLLPECSLKARVLTRSRTFVEGMSESFREALPKAFREGFAQPLANQEQEQEQEQEQDRSVPNGTGAAGAAPATQALPVDRIQVAGMLHIAEDGPLSEEQEKLIWNGGLAVLLASYDATLPAKAQDAKARMFVGGLAKRVKDAGADRRHLFDVIREACVERPIHPESWMSAAIASRLGKRSAPNRQEAQEQRNHAGTDAWAARMAAEIAAQSGTTQPTGA